MAAHQIREAWKSVVWSPNLNDSFQVKRPASGSAPMRAGSIGIYVMLVTSEVSTDDKPAMMNSVARVTMNDGSPVRTTMKPLIAPRHVVRTIATTIDSQIGRP